MSKKHKKFSDFNSRPVVQFPIPISMDDLATYSDADLAARGDLMRSEMNKAINHGVDPQPWQVELAYLQRESDIRNVRVAAHDRYVRLNPEANVNSFSTEEVSN